MQSVKVAASGFLANKRIAVTGVSRASQAHGSNNVYKRLRERGYEVFAVNPNADEVEGTRYQDLKSIRGRRGGDRNATRARRGHHARVLGPRYPTGVDAPGPGEREAFRTPQRPTAGSTASR